MISNNRYSTASLNHRRAAYTLLQTVAMMVTMGMLTSLSALVLHRAFKSHQSTLEHFQQIRSLRLAHQQLTRDAHRAIDLKLDEEIQIRISADTQFAYRIDNDRLIRQTVRTGQIVGTQDWQLPAPSKGAFSLDETGQENSLLVVSFYFDSLKPGHGRNWQPINWKMRVGSSNPTE